MVMEMGDKLWSYVSKKKKKKEKKRKKKNLDVFLFIQWNWYSIWFSVCFAVVYVKALISNDWEKTERQVFCIFYDIRYFSCHIKAYSCNRIHTGRQALSSNLVWTKLLDGSLLLSLWKCSTFDCRVSLTPWHVDIFHCLSMSLDKKIVTQKICAPL